MKVLPKNDDLRRVLAHPNAGKFRAEGSADWPDDSFTNRRIKDGDITKEEVEAKQPPPAKEKEKEDSRQRKTHKDDE
jgi:hypothetical protein